MRIRIALSVFVLALVGWAGCRNLPTSPEAKDVLSTLSVSPDSTPQLQSGYIYWTNVAWGFIERYRTLKCGIDWGVIPPRPAYRYRYWLTITTENYEPRWSNYLYAWMIRVYNIPTDPSGWFYERFSVRRDSTVIPDIHMVETGYVFESCSFTRDVRLRISRKVYDKQGHFLHSHTTPTYTVHVRPLW